MRTCIGIPEDTVKNRLFTGRKHIRKGFAMENYTKQSYEPDDLWIASTGQTGIDDEPFITKVDFNRLARVMENLFANVIKYAEPHTYVRLESKVGTGSIRISLSNTIRKGAEVSTEDMFDRFYRDDQSRTDTDSAGLGLAIAKKIIELHGGEISAKKYGDVLSITISMYYA